MLLVRESIAPESAVRVRTGTLSLDQFETVCGPAPVPIVDELVLDLLPFEQRRQSGPLHRGDMDESVLRPIIGLNEAKTAPA